MSISSGSGDGNLIATGTMTYDAIGDLLTVDGPLAGSADTTRFRYDAARNRVGTVSADPDGSGALKHRAMRSAINADGQVTKVERGTVDSQSDADWSAFTPIEAAETDYDANARAVTRKLVSGGTVHVLTQTSYDALGRPECTAQRMNTAAFGSTPLSACNLGTQGSFGPDRIQKTIYNAAGEVTQVKVALGTPDEANDVTATYRNNGQVETVTDGENNKTTYVYDGHDRLSQTYFPSATKSAGVSNASDFEQLGYDANGNVTSFRNRAGETIAFTFDALNRLMLKDLPGGEPDVSYGHDLLGRMTSASQSGHALSLTYDALSRNVTQAGPQGTVTSTYDRAGRRTRIAHPDGFYVDQDHLVTGEISAIRENGATSGIGVLATFGYDDLGRRTRLTRSNGTATSYGYGPVSRLTSLTQDVASAHDLTLSFSHNPSGQIASNTRSNDVYAWPGLGPSTTSSPANGLNQLTAIGGMGTSHDARGNMTADGLGRTFGYTSEKSLTSAQGGVTLAYDPAMRLYQLTGAATTRFGYDGSDLVAEYDSANSLQRRYVHGPGTDEPLVWYEGPGISNRRFLHADERGSIVAVSNASGGVASVNTYDEYGKPAPANIGRFQYTGQTWLPEVGLHYYKARMYHPTLGRFMQTDPISFGDGMNLYGYVRGDPVNLVDPSGMNADIFVTGNPYGSNVPLPMPGDLLVGMSVIGSTTFEPEQHIFVDGTRLKKKRAPIASGAVRQPTPTGNKNAVEPQKPKPFTCADAIKEPGTLETVTFTYTAVLVGGVTGANGTFRNTRTGTTGNFFTLGGGAGLDIGVSVTYGQVRSAADLAGFAATVSGTIGPIAGSGSFNAKGEFVGAAGGVAPPSKGGSGTLTGTKLYGCARGG